MDPPSPYNGEVPPTPRATLSKPPGTVHTNLQTQTSGPFGSPTMNYSSPRLMHDTTDLADPSSSDDGFPDASRTPGLILEERQFPGLFTSRSALAKKGAKNPNKRKSSEIVAESDSEGDNGAPLALETFHPVQLMGNHPVNSTSIHSPSSSSMSMSPAHPSRLTQRPTHPKLDQKLNSELRSPDWVGRLEESNMPSTTFSDQQFAPTSRDEAALTQQDSPIRQETAHPKASKAATTRKVVSDSTKPKPALPKTRKPTSVKPKSSNPDTAKSKPAQQNAQPDVALPSPVGIKTPKRRSSASHPKTPKSKMLKTDTPALDPVLNTTVHTNTTPLNQVSAPVRIGAGFNGEHTEHGIGYLDQATPAPASSPIPATGLANLSLDRPSQVQSSARSQSIVPEAFMYPAPPSIVPESVGTSAELIVPESIGTSTHLIVSDVSDKRAQGIQQAPTQPDRFPSFQDGDVMIISPTGKTWKLHSAILMNASPAIKTILQKYEPIHITKRQREDGETIRWKLHMVDEPDAEWADPDGLKFKTFKPVPVNGKAISLFAMPRNINGLGAEPQFDKLYDNFFKCLYNINPEFGSRATDPEAQQYIVDTHMLVEAANYLEAIPAVRVSVEANLLRLNQVLWVHLCERPEAWIHLAGHLQSPLIFREAMIHIVGRYHIKGGIQEEQLMNDRHGQLGRKIWDLIVKKAKELKDKKLLVERRLFDYYPARMLHKQTDTHIPGRQIYSDDIYFWQALTIYRQFCSSAYLTNMHHRAADGGLFFYRKIASGNYLSEETLDSFHECFHMTKPGKKRLAEVLQMIKNDMKPLVKDLLVDESKGDRGKNAPPLEHMTCVNVLDEEFPWYVTPVVEQSGDVEMSGAL